MKIMHDNVLPLKPALEAAERGGYALMPEWETKPANQYLPRRVRAAAGEDSRERRDLGGGP